MYQLAFSDELSQIALKMTTEQHYNPQNPPKTCPQCQKKGAKRRVKHFYINLDEEVKYNTNLHEPVLKPYDSQGVFMCEDVNCPWPFNMKNVIKFDVSLANKN